MAHTANNERTPLLGRQSAQSISSSASSLSLTSDSRSSDSSDDRSRPASARPKSVAEEEATLGPARGAKEEVAATPIGRIILVLLIGGFISNADGSLLLATHPIIASEFNALSDSSWLVTSFALATAATQPLYGKLSDIYGRKSLLLVAYTLFGLGCFLVGMGTCMWQVVLGRVISGAGASGMTTLVSILITDLVPLREVASWRSYVNVVATTGRSIGGPLGGSLADTVGWRWSFLGQVPLAGIAIILVYLTLPSTTPCLPPGPKQSKLARIDFLGAAFMTLAILCFLFPLEIGGVKVSWNHPIIFILLFSAFVFGVLLLATEAWYAKEPIFPMELLRQRDALISFLISSCQSAAQMGLMFAVPLYFQITSQASNTVAGAHLIPAVVGNAVGGILSGVIIKRTGRYKALIILATVCSSSAYLLLIIRWHGHTNWAESLYILPGGFGMGIVQSALFISLQAAIDPAHAAVAASSLYLASSIGTVAGLAGVSAVLQQGLRFGLGRRLKELGIGEGRIGKIIGHAASDVHYIDHAKPAIAKAVVQSYVEALTWTHGLSLLCSSTALIGSIFLGQHKL
ncbi:MFS general substrate transporter [Melanomma pulvis-pyrius CBS 109.77]|uniref:MFS general substrate transporter n=1 Tax=Melanomma pulvis-pyrius CBS 109.77 TaxID=1314802 RepID=A0A6A6X614_9PLEO|nr:MFS general substrate transporter [Melanomma pulvis-pyrius CBS 109.77]